MRVQFSIAVCLAWAILAVAVAVEENILEDQTLDFIDEDVEDSKPVVAELKKSGFTARTFDWAKKMAKWMGYDYEDYEDEEYYDYYYPVPQYESNHIATGGGHGGSSYVSYQQHHPGQFHHSPARDDYVTDDDTWGWTDMFFDMAVTVAPIALILAAMPSGFFTFAVRRRSFGDNLLDDSFDADALPILKDLMENDWLAFTDRECQERMFCEISQLGEKDESSVMQKSFYYAASLTPDFVARKVGLTDVFRATRYGQCDIFRCGPSPPDAFEPVSNDLDSPNTNDTEADLTEPFKE